MIWMLSNGCGELSGTSMMRMPAIEDRPGRRLRICGRHPADDRDQGAFGEVAAEILGSAHSINSTILLAPARNASFPVDLAGTAFPQSAVPPNRGRVSSGRPMTYDLAVVALAKPGADVGPDQQAAAIGRGVASRRPGRAARARGS